VQTVLYLPMVVQTVPSNSRHCYTSQESVETPVLRRRLSLDPQRRPCLLRTCCVPSCSCWPWSAPRVWIHWSSRPSTDWLALDPNLIIIIIQRKFCIAPQMQTQQRKLLCNRETRNKTNVPSTYSWKLTTRWSYRVSLWERSSM